MTQYAIVLAALLVVAATGWSQGQVSAPLDSQEQYTSVDVIEVSGREYAVDVIGEDRGDVLVSIYTTEPRRIHVEASGGRLTIGVERRILQVLRQTQPGRIVVTVPRDTVLDLRTASGAVSIKGVTESDRLTASSASGAISVENSRGTMEIRTASGALQFTDVQGDLTIRSASGRVSMTQVSGAISAETASGAIVGEDVILTGDSHLKSTSGRVQLDTDLDDLRVNARSVSGRISVGSSRGKDVAFGNGAIALTVRTVSGNQRIE